MDIFFYLLLFVIGTLFGSFYTLALYRIPQKQDIIHTPSHCPNCNHKLGFLDLIPIVSYVFLNGKCRYCKEKIKLRYIMIEVFSGMLFVLIALLMQYKIENFNSAKILQYSFIILYVTFLILICRNR